ncbi:MAG: MBL fold metallo-hydrolase [Ethanoligenens sp.]|uniref:MBL fold metallo-hydrolase n=1 Tax=Ethanoligenens sp. TaxID=2099655 RepID=UPI0039EC962E
MDIKYLRVGQIGTNCYIVCDKAGGKCAVIDPGADAQRIIAAVEENGCVPQMILLTHGHYDHIGAVHELLAHFHCKLAVPKMELDFLNNPHRNLQSSVGGGNFEPFRPDILFEDGDTVEVAGLKFHVLHTPGHTPGSCCLLCEDVMFSGDTLFAGSAGRTDFPGGDPAAMRVSMKKLAALSGNFQVLPGHGGFSTLDEERANNPFLAGAADA